MEEVVHFRNEGVAEFNLLCQGGLMMPKLRFLTVYDEYGDGKIRVSKAKIEFPTNCPANCPEKESPFFQRNFCYRCPIFNCRGEHPLIEPELYREDWAREWKRWFTSGMKGLPNLTLPTKE